MTDTYELAVHEAGHAIMIIHELVPLVGLDITDGGDRLCEDTLDAITDAGDAMLIRDVLASARILIAGNIAEQICLGEVSQPCNDDEDQIKGVWRALAKRVPGGEAEWLRRGAEATVRAVLIEHKEDLEAIANQLEFHGALTGDDVQRIIGGNRMRARHAELSAELAKVLMDNGRLAAGPTHPLSATFQARNAKRIEAIRTGLAGLEKAMEAQGIAPEAAVS